MGADGGNTMIKTFEEAIAKAASRWYEGKSPQEIVEFQLYEDKLCMPLQLYQEAVEKVLGRPDTPMSIKRLKD